MSAELRGTGAPLASPKAPGIKGARADCRAAEKATR